MNIKKRDFIIDKVELRNTPNFFHSPFSQIIDPFLDSWISANHDKGMDFQPMVESL